MKFTPVFLLGVLAAAPTLADLSDHEMQMSEAHSSHPDTGGQMAEAASQNHSDMKMDASPMSMEHHHGRPILENPHLEPQQRKYWEQYNTTTFFTAAEGSKFNLWMHTLLLFGSFGLLGPLTLLCSTDSRTQWFYVPLQTAQSSMVIASLFFLAVYSATAPQLYPGNAYAGFSVAMLVLVIVHWVAMITKSITSYLSLDEYSYAGDHEFAAFSEEQSMNDTEDPHTYVLDEVSQDGREASMSSTVYGSGSDTDLSSVDTDRDSLRKHFRDRPLPKSKPVQPSALVRKLSGNKIFVKLNTTLGRFSTVLFTLLNYPLYFTGCGYMLTGLATAFLMGKDKKVFALLAHFIKGSVFFFLGFVELARFFGVGAAKGWAWNEIHVRVPKKTANRSPLSRFLNHLWPDYPTFEFIQSFLIFFYGGTNVFLEHLGNEDGVWSHKDLQHASIAFMFFGGGLCGLVLESRNVKRLVLKGFRISTEKDDNSQSVRRGWSMNPLPAFIIFWTGALMSHHQQETELATQIHVQWGTMFSIGAVVRLITIALLCTKPRCASHEEAAAPQRPFTEIIVAFCLICGGMIFMASNRETVEGMLYRGIDQMFTLNVSVGIAVLMMAYFVGCLALKGLTSLRYSN